MVQAHDAGDGRSVCEFHANVEVKLVRVRIAGTDRVHCFIGGALGEGGECQGSCRLATCSYAASPVGAVKRCAALDGLHTRFGHAGTSTV